MRTRNQVIGLVAWLVLATDFPPASAQQEACKTLDAQIQLRVATEGCLSPMKFCTTGEIVSPTGFLNGATWAFTGLATAPSAGLPESTEPPGTLSYAGRVQITAPNGTLTTSDVGVFDPKAGALSQLDRIVGGQMDEARMMGGAERFGHATGVLFVTATGSVNTGFQARVRGQVCLTN